MIGISDPLSYRNDGFRPCLQQTFDHARNADATYFHDLSHDLGNARTLGIPPRYSFPNSNQPDQTVPVRGQIWRRKMNNNSRANQSAIPPLLSGFDQLPDSAHVPIKTVCALFGCSPATAWRRVRSGHLAKPVRIGAGSTRWSVGDLRRSLKVLNPVKEAQ